MLALKHMAVVKKVVRYKFCFVKPELHSYVQHRYDMILFFLRTR